MLASTGSKPMTDMPNARHLEATSRPIFPTPMMPSVFPISSVPMNFFLSHFPANRLMFACGIFRESERSIETVCSAVEIVFPPGVFITMIPWREAAVTSMLSTPAPALPITFIAFASSIMSAVTFVPLRTIRAAYSGIIFLISSGEIPGFASTWNPSRVKISTQLCSIGSLMSIFMGVLSMVGCDVSCCGSRI